MTIKDMQYFRDFDLDAAAMVIAGLGTERRNNDLFGDAIQALLIRAKEECIPADLVQRVLGDPDVVRPFGEKTIWEYNWVDLHGPMQYSSSTPLLLNQGALEGLADE